MAARELADPDRDHSGSVLRGKDHPDSYRMGIPSTRGDTVSAHLQARQKFTRLLGLFLRAADSRGETPALDY